MAHNLTKNELIAPTIHLNGSARGELEAKLDLAAEAVNRAINALMECYPHGRDYYPQGDTAYDKAVMEHRLRMTNLVTTRDQLMEISQHIARTARRGA